MAFWLSQVPPLLSKGHIKEGRKVIVVFKNGLPYQQKADSLSSSRFLHSKYTNKCIHTFSLCIAIVPWPLSAWLPKLEESRGCGRTITLYKPTTVNF